MQLADSEQAIQQSREISLTALKAVLIANAGLGILSNLLEADIKEIFDSMHVSKNETRIHWHEFIAAGLLQCQVDDCKLWIVFDQLDSDHKGVHFLIVLMVYVLSFALSIYSLFFIN